MDFNKIAIFVRVIDSGSITKAAKFLKQPKSRISRNLAALERDLGIALLYRTTRQFSPTEAGRNLYERCRNQVYELEAAAQSLQENSNEVSGTLKLAAPEDLGSKILGSFLAELHSLYPKLKVDVFLSNEVIDIVKEGIDLTIRIGELEDTTLKSRVFGQIVLILVASPEYLKRAPKIESLTDLSKHPALVFEPETPSDLWILSSGGKKEETVRVQAHCRANHPKILLDFALAGQGVALIPEFLCLDALKSGALKRVLKNYSTKPSPVQFLWPASREMNPKVRACIDLGVKRLSKYCP